MSEEGNGAGHLANPILRPPTTLLSLPKELLRNITLSLDLRSALSFATVSRACVEPAQHRIWRDLDLSLHPNWGEFPLVRPLSHQDHGYCHWAQNVALAAENRHREKVKERIKDIIWAGGRRKLALVKTLKLVPRVGVNNVIVTLLDMIADNVANITIEVPATHIFQQQWAETMHQGLSIKIVDFGAIGRQFSALTHLTIGKDVLKDNDLFVTICNAAPKLQYLDIYLSDLPHPIDEDEEEPDWDYESGTSRDRKHGHVDFATTNMSLSVLRLRSGIRGCSHVTIKPIVNVLFEQIDHLDILEIHEATFRDWENDEYQEMYDTIDHGLEVLRFPKTKLPEVLPYLVKSADMDEPCLRRVAALPEGGKDGSGHIELVELPEHPTLEHVRYEVDLHNAPRVRVSTSNSPFPEYRSVKPITPALIQPLRQSPKLRTVEFVPLKHCKEDYDVEPFPFNTWYEKKIGGSLIRSFTNGAAHDLYHIRTLSSFTRGPVEKRESQDTHRAKRHHRYARQWTDEEGESQLSWFHRAEEKEWEDATDYKGLVVPLEVMREMRKAEGIKAGVWEGRGIEVGDQGWKVLTEWYDRQISAKEAAIAQAAAAAAAAFLLAAKQATNASVVGMDTGTEAGTGEGEGEGQGNTVPGVVGDKQTGGIGMFNNGSTATVASTKVTRRMSF